MNRLALFSPTIVASLGTFSIPQSLLMSTPRMSPFFHPRIPLPSIPPKPTACEAAVAYILSAELPNPRQTCPKSAVVLILQPM